MRKIRTFPAFLIVLGALLLINTTNVSNISVKLMIPLLMISVGVIKVANSFLEE